MELQVKHLKSNEIRVGNNVLFNKEIIKLDGSLFAMYLENRLGMPFYPIPLTEDILLRLGFEEEGEMYHILICEADKIINKKELRLDEDSDGWFVDIIECDLDLDSEKYSINIAKNKYLHQLQNLYFALTRQELEFKQ